MLGAKTSTKGSVAASSASQSTRPASLSGSGIDRSSDVTAPASRARAKSRRSSAPPPANIERIERRVAEVEDPGGGQSVVRDVVAREAVVGPGAVQEAAVHARRADHDRVARGLLGRDDHPGRQAGVLLTQRGEHAGAEEVVAHPADQPHADAQAVQRQPGVEHRAAGGQVGRAHVDERAGLERRRAVQARDHVEADVPGDDHVGARHGSELHDGPVAL